MKSNQLNVHRSLSQEIPNEKKTYLTEGVSQNWKHQMAIDQLPRAAASDGTADWNAVNGGGAAFVLAVDEKGETIPGRFLKVRKTRKKRVSLQMNVIGIIICDE